MWDRSAKTVTCLACAPGETAAKPGVAGASAATEGARRRDKTIEEVRRKHGDHAAEVAKEMAERDNVATWGKGSKGASRLAAFVEREVGDAVIPLHDRMIPGTRGNIDHIFVASTGVWVVDAKALKGKVVQREDGPIWRREKPRLRRRPQPDEPHEERRKPGGGRDRGTQGDPELTGTDVHAGLCFLDSEWALLDFPFQVGFVWVMYPGALRKRLKKRGAVSRDKMERIARRLDLSLPRA
jgi:hypothetical protein